MYIYGTYIPPLERASLSSFLYQALNTTTQVLLTFSYNPSHIIPNPSICATLLSTILLLPPPYCNLSCCPLAPLLLQFSSFQPRPDSNIPNQSVIKHNAYEG